MDSGPQHTADGLDGQDVLEALRLLLGGSGLLLRRLGGQLLRGGLLRQAQLPPPFPLVLRCAERGCEVSRVQGLKLPYDPSPTWDSCGPRGPR